MPTPQSRRLKSRPRPVSFQVGPPIQPYDQLLLWLNQLDTLHQRGQSRRLIKLPVCIQRSEPDRLGLGPAHIGSTLEDLKHGAIHLKLDDSALGESIYSRFQFLCPQDAHYCALWLEGYWGPLLPSPLSEDRANTLTSQSTADGPFTFAILTVGDRIDNHHPLPDPLTAFIA